MVDTEHNGSINKSTLERWCVKKLLTTTKGKSYDEYNTTITSTYNDVTYLKQNN